MKLEPRTRRTAQNVQHTYSLDSRVYDVKTYPVQSPQGATILIYGHTNGIQLVWRGGRRLKPAKQAEKQNGSNLDNAVMIIDSDDETPAPSKKTLVDKPEFEETATTNTSPPEIIQTLDLALGTAVHHIAVLPMPSCTCEDAAWNGAEILKEKLVFAVTCGNADVYVVTLPLTPPSHESKERPELQQSLLAGNAGKGVWGETLTLLGGQTRSSEGVAITLARNRTASGSRSRSLERTGIHGHTATRAIVSAHSREASGTLRLWDVTLDAKLGTVTRLEPFQTEYLPHPLNGISFNPLHLTQLLAVDSPHAVRVFDYSVPAFPSDDTSDGPFPNQGSWLLSLYPSFSRSSAMSTVRKPIVAAEWIAHGRAVLVLLADGQWGIWDIDGASPSTNSSGSLLSKASAGLRGSAITVYSVQGHLEGTSPLRNPVSQRSTTGPSTGEFVPMTPHTRRDAIAATISSGPEKLVAVRGGITIARLTARSSEPANESVILWLGGADPIVSVIPVVSKFWESQLRRAAGGGVNLWSGSQPTRMIRLTELNAGLVGERCTGVTAIAKPGAARIRSGSPSETGSGSSEGLPVEVLLQGEYRLVIVHESEDNTSLTTRLIGARKKARVNTDSTKAIIAFPRPEKPHSVAFNLSVSRRGNQMMNLRPRPSVKNLFAEPLPSTEEAASSFGQQRPRDAGLMFINDLNNAADVPDDESEAENRDIEQEMMDIMEIDRELEQLESDRDRGTKRVFFEEG
ncbi:nucleoporin NUP37 [Rhypophila decipiens]|uniref:Nucleoporin NUP37 n=1 Tax=Rhypophila decipiens TaxID=261697 RepID=A0AAN6YGW9_9PEZI|nr:nucleoporin NUP37 [Rhypophila decipiens]